MRDVISEVMQHKSNATYVRTHQANSACFNVQDLKAEKDLDKHGRDRLKISFSTNEGRLHTLSLYGKPLIEILKEALNSPIKSGTDD